MDMPACLRHMTRSLESVSWLNNGGVEERHSRMMARHNEGTRGLLQSLKYGCLDRR